MKMGGAGLVSPRLEKMNRSIGANAELAEWAACAISSLIRIWRIPTCSGAYGSEVKTASTIRSTSDSPSLGEMGRLAVLLPIRMARSEEHTSELQLRE